MAGSFYITSGEFLNGKVYMVQNPQVTICSTYMVTQIFLEDGKTRFGPTALSTISVLERYKGIINTVGQCLKTMNIDGNIN